MPVLVSLQCRACGAKLPTSAERRIFVCEGCGRSWAPARAQAELEEIPRRVVRPRQPIPPRGTLVLLPVWVLPIRWVEPPSAALPLPREIRLPAVGIDRLQLLLSFASNLTRAGGTWDLLEGIHAHPEPAEVTMEDAFEMAELVTLRSVEGWPPDDVLDQLEIPFGPPRLLDLPCQWDGTQLLDLVVGRCVSTALLGEQVFRDQREEISATLSRVTC